MTECTGEASCLICIRQENYLWWLSVGDCMLFMIHPDLIQFGQGLLNQRNFYEWIGKVNTFDLLIPCYSSGCREIRTGTNVITMITDGFMEKDRDLHLHMERLFEIHSCETVDLFLHELHLNQRRDSTTIITWSIDNKLRGAMPSEG